MNFIGVSGKRRAFAGREIIHFHASAVDADGVEDLRHLFRPFAGPEIPGFKMTAAFHASDDAHAVCSFFKGPQHMNHIDFSGAGHPDDFDAGGVAKSHRTCQVRGGIPSVVAAERENNGLKFQTHSTPSSKASTLLISCSSSYQLRSMAFAGHSAAQAPQPWHRASSIKLNPSSLIFGTL